MKIGRNDPCHCGSGKKYKRCCMAKDEQAQKNRAAQTTVTQSQKTEEKPLREITLADVEQMNTTTIIKLIEEFGVPFERKTFREAIKQFYAAEEMVEHWLQQYPVRLYEYTVAFLVNAVYVLWLRIGPKKYLPGEAMALMYEQGANLTEQGEFVKAMDLWLQVWDAIKLRQDGSKTLLMLADAYAQYFFVQEFVQDLELELQNAGLENPAYFRKRIHFCREFCELFPEADRELIINMRRAIADSYHYLGEAEKAETCYAQLVADFPQYYGSYLAWGDYYYLLRKDNFARAKEVYAKASEVAQDDAAREIVAERLNGMA